VRWLSAPLSIMYRSWLLYGFAVNNILCSTTDLRSSLPDSNHEVDGPPAASSETDNINYCN
jgi:hypothetical protein